MWGVGVAGVGVQGVGVQGCVCGAHSLLRVMKITYRIDVMFMN